MTFLSAIYNPYREPYFAVLKVLPVPKNTMQTDRQT